MISLKTPDKPLVSVDKKFFTVGCGAMFDFQMPGASEGLCFSIQQDSGENFLVPGGPKILLNGKSIHKKTKLNLCDVIEVGGSKVVVLDDLTKSSGNQKTEFANECLAMLGELSRQLEACNSTPEILGTVLKRLVDLSGAETGYLLSDIRTPSQWELLASSGSGSKTRRELVSNTILSKAIETKKPVFAESIVGHPLSQQASLLGAQVYSFACLPLVVMDRVFGCLYLYTRSPGRVIREEVLEQLKILATQATLLIASVLKRNQDDKCGRATAFETALVFDETASSHPMRAVVDRIRKLANSDLSVVIMGETGTGKELAAQALHAMSSRKNGPFVAINCGAIPPTLIESALFGHTKGAFTGATRDQIGKIEQANHGTLFLDEIGDLPLEMQVKLLRVLQDKKIEPVGGSGAKPIDVRVISATHRHLEEMISRGTFRSDLFYRLNGATIKLPPLRDRGGDSVLLARHFLAENSHLRLSLEAEEKIRRHKWPGNVRELQQVILRASALAEGDVIGVDDLELSQRPLDEFNEIGVQMEQLGLELKEAQRKFTQHFIRRTLDGFGGNRAKAAGHLGISERTLYRFLSDDTTDRDV